MAQQHDDHEGPIHQAPWVPWVTMGASFLFFAIIVLVRLSCGGPVH